jgi:MFS family permease
MSPKALGSSAGASPPCQKLHSLLVLLSQTTLLKAEFAIILFMLQRYNTLYEQYYYIKEGANILRKTSFDFPNGSFCVSSGMINNYTNDSNGYKEDQSYSNHLVAYGQLLNTLPSVIVALLLGPLMDRFGRKIGFILPYIGKILQGAISLCIVYYNLDPHYLLIPQFVSGLFGDFPAILAASFSYIADTSTLRWRSLRVAVIEGLLSYGGAIGTTVTGYWLLDSHCKFMPLLWFYISVSVFLLVYAIFLIPESLNPMHNEDKFKKPSKGLQPYIQGFRLYFGGLSPRSTWKLYVSTIVTVIAVLNIYGAQIIEVYFVKAPPFDLTTLQTGLYQTTRSLSVGTADFLIMGLLAILWASDTWVMLIALLFHCVGNLLVGFATKAWQLYTSKSL